MVKIGCMYVCMYVGLYVLTRAPLEYSAERAPLGGGDSAPCLTPERMVV